MAIFGSLLVTTSGQAADTQATVTPPTHGLAMHGDLKYGPNFTHFDYTNPDAPKGGELRLDVVGSGFDSFNPFIIKGVPAAGTSSYLYDTLTKQSGDEAFSEYGLIAERMEMPDDRSWVKFHLNPKASFQDGHPITAADVVFSFNILMTDGHPFFRSYYGDVDKAIAESEHTVKFTFKNGTNRELPLILGQLAVMPAHYWKDREFGKTSLDIPVGSGPYQIASFENGKRIVYKRNPNYWAANLPVNKGQYNFDTVSFEYFGDPTVALEGFFAGVYDFRQESTAKVWATRYAGPKFDSGEIIKEAVPHQQPVGMQAFVMNSRRALFSDRRVREALSYGFDFEWTNKQLFFGQYTRTTSYFENSELASKGLPSAEEIAVLEPYRAKLPPEVFTATYQPPATDGSGNLRNNLRKAMALFKDAGWAVKDGKMTNTQTGQTFSFEFLLVNKDFERVVLPFIQNLEKLGINATVRLVDTSQYVERVRKFDFDIVVGGMGQSNSPGNEQRDYWLAENANVAGSRNSAGVADPVVDALVAQVIAAPDRASLITRVRALDRVLLAGHYVIPNWYLAVDRVAYWNKFGMPKVHPNEGVNVDTWWAKP